MTCIECDNKDASAYYGTRKGWLCCDCAVSKFHRQLIRLRRKYTKLSKAYNKLLKITEYPD